MHTAITKRTAALRAVSGAMLWLSLALPRTAAGQQMWFPAPDREQRFGPNRFSVDVGIVAVSAGYSRQISPNAELGLAMSGGAQTGFVLLNGDLTGEAPSLFVELLSGAAFMRRGVGNRNELESGVRVAWLYHSTEYETLFRGVYMVYRHRLGAARLGPTVYLGHVSEESGRTGVVFALVPLTLSFRWSW